MVNAFATEYKESMSSGGCEPFSVLIADLKPAQPPKSRSKNPLVVIWTRDTYTSSLKDSKNGETAGDSSNARKKAKAGRPVMAHQMMGIPRTATLKGVTAHLLTVQQ
jgi:hypothetical protein